MKNFLPSIFLLHPSSSDNTTPSPTSDDVIVDVIGNPDRNEPKTPIPTLHAFDGNQRKVPLSLSVAMVASFFMIFAIYSVYSSYVLFESHSQFQEICFYVFASCGILAILSSLISLLIFLGRPTPDQSETLSAWYLSFAVASIVLIVHASVFAVPSLIPGIGALFL